MGSRVGAKLRGRRREVCPALTPPERNVWRESDASKAERRARAFFLRPAGRSRRRSAFARSWSLTTSGASWRNSSASIHPSDAAEYPSHCTLYLRRPRTNRSPTTFSTSHCASGESVALTTGGGFKKASDGKRSESAGKCGRSLEAWIRGWMAR